MERAGAKERAAELGAAALRQGRWVLAGYAQVLFNTRPLVGALALAATFVSPEHGLTGLLGLLSANLGAWLLELDVNQRQQGYYAFNGLLFGLALGLYYRLNVPFVVAILVGGVLCAALAAGLKSVFDRLLGVPVLSLPFLVVSWLLYAGADRFPGLEVTLAPVQAAAPMGEFLPIWLDTFFRSFGAIYFQLSAVSGVLVCGALLLWSRVAFLVGVVGYLVGQAVYLTLGGDPADLTGQLVGFNFILSAVAVGSVWTLPTVPGVALGAATGAVAALLSAAGAAVLGRLGLPVLAFPFIGTTVLMLLALRARPKPTRLRAPVRACETPEAALEDDLVRRERFVPADRLGLPLPVGGRWRVTQSFDGPHTHKGPWEHGLDLEAIDQDGLLFRNGGEAPGDYYCFGAPVFAPLAGRVVAVQAHLRDNEIGYVDHDHPWGNTVVLWHAEGVYSAYSHLAEGSVAVRVGADVAAGALLGRSGSSGRSPRPHLHMQVQASPAVGAPTVPWTLLHWLTPDGGDQLRYHTHGVPREGEELEAVIPSVRISDALSFPLGQRRRYRVTAGGRTWEETWRAELDFESRLWLTSEPSGARLRLYRSPFVLLAEAYEGPRDTALRRLYLGLPRAPLTDRGGVVWDDRLEPAGAVGPLREALASLALPAGRFAWLSAETGAAAGGNGRHLFSTTLRPGGPLAANGGARRVVVEAEAERGVERIEETVGDDTVLVAELDAVEVVGEVQ